MMILEDRDQHVVPDLLQVLNTGFMLLAKLFGKCFKIQLPPKDGFNISRTGANTHATPGLTEKNEPRFHSQPVDGYCR